jgi:hypothetical protein
MRLIALADAAACACWAGVKDLPSSGVVLSAPEPQPVVRTAIETAMRMWRMIFQYVFAETRAPWTLFRLD